MERWVLQRRLVLHVCVASVIGSFLALLSLLPCLLGGSLVQPFRLNETDGAGVLGVEALWNAVEANEGEHADES